MNWTHWLNRRQRLMAEEPGNGGDTNGGGAAGAASSGGDGANNGGATEQKPGDGGTAAANLATEQNPGGTDQNGNGGTKPKTAAAGLLGEDGGGDTPAATFTDEQYAEGFKELPEDVRNACAEFADHFRAAGLNPEAAAKLAKAWAEKQQAEFEKFEDATAAKGREYVGTWTAQDRTDAAAAIRHFVKPDTYLDNVIRNSPVGNDPDFLNLLKAAGATMRADNAAGAGAKGAAGAEVALSKQLGIDI